MSKPRLLDLFSGAGGCAVGYHRAGFDVTGVDCKPQPHYPFRHVVADALEYLALHGAEYDVIHASPPCQRYTQAARLNDSADRHPDLVAPVRGLLEQSGKVWVIENVPGAPLHFSALVCGLALGCGVKRHRYFESSVLLLGTTCPPGHRGDFLSVFGHGSAQRVGGKGWVSVFGGGAPAKADNRRRADAELARKAMGIDWMNRDELSQAVPPAYTEFLGKQLLRALKVA